MFVQDIAECILILKKIFEHIDKSVSFGNKNSLHKDGEYNLFDKKTKPDYRNWVPISLLKNVIGGTIITFILFMIFAETNFFLSGSSRIICGIILGTVVFILLFFSIMLSFMYRTFDYRGKRKLAKTIIEGALNMLRYRTVELDLI